MLYLSAFSVKLSFNQNNAVQSTVDWQFYNLIGKVKVSTDLTACKESRVR